MSILKQLYSKFSSTNLLFQLWSRDIDSTFVYEKLVYVSSFLSLFKLSLIYLLPLNSAWETKKPNFAKGHRDIIPCSKIKEKERKLKTENEEEEEEEKEYKQTVR